MFEFASREKGVASRHLVVKRNGVQHTKGDDTGAGRVKCRFVGMELAHEKREDVFAGTLPLWAARLLSKRVSKLEVQCCLLSKDVVSAFLHANVLRATHVELPAEDHWEFQETWLDFCGKPPMGLAMRLRLGKRN